MIDGRGARSPGHVRFTRTARLARRMMVPVAGALVLWGVVPAVASAGVGWRLNGTPLTEPVATSWKGTQKLTDTKVPLVGTVAVECEDTAEGVSGVGGAGEVTKWTASKCATKTGECGSPSMEAVHLPWHGELVLVEGATRDKLVNSGKGAPGYKLKCQIFGINVVDECTGVLSATTTNVTGGVTAAFNASEKLNCSQGGSGSGSLEGSQSILASSGTLSAEAGGALTWLHNEAPITEASAIGWKGTVTLSDFINGLGTIAVKCEDTGSGTAGVLGSGEMTQWTISNCSPVFSSHCESEAAIEALHLPWHTELAVVEGAIRNVITNGGKGTPLYKLKCKASGTNITDECPVPNMAMTNTKSGVTATFEKEKFSCVAGPSGDGQLEGSQAIELHAAGLLQVS